MKEIWKSIKNYEGYYEVSTLGRVRSLDRVIGGKCYNGNLKSLYKDANGYLYVILTKDRISKKFPVHRLVAETFIPNPDNKHEVDHKNTIRSDSRADNLRWVSHKENMNNSISKMVINIRSHTKDVLERGQIIRIERGRKTARRKVYQFNIDGTFITSYESIQQAAKENYLKAGDISSVCRQKRGKRQSGGFLWSYTNSCPEYKPYASKWKKIAQCDIEGNVIKIWDSLNEATNATGINNISRAAKIGTKQPIAGGFRWMYIK